MQASIKFKNRWPCQKFWSSADAKVETADTAMTFSASLGRTVGTASLGAATLCATEWQISHVLWSESRFYHEEYDADVKEYVLYNLTDIAEPKNES